MGALDGIRILDLSRLLPGPYCSMLLADFGAEVIKIEEPGRGDYSRSFPPFQNGFGYWHLQLNRNKKSVALDLKSDAGRAAFLKLVQTADVVLESYRPGVLKRLGIDYETVSRLNPKIVYCAITGYGKRGPLVDQADHDIGYVSLAGITSMSGEPGGRPAIPGILMADMNAALMAGMSILMAVRHAEQIGTGQEIDISLYNTALTLMPGAASLYFGSGFVAERGNNWLTGAYANYNIYETRDGRYVSVGCLEKKFWSNLCRHFHGKAQLLISADLFIFYRQHHCIRTGLLRSQGFVKIQYRRYAGILPLQTSRPLLHGFSPENPGQLVLNALMLRFIVQGIDKVGAV